MLWEVVFLAALPAVHTKANIYVSCVAIVMRDHQPARLGYRREIFLLIFLGKYDARRRSTISESVEIQFTVCHTSQLCMQSTYHELAPTFLVLFLIASKIGHPVKAAKKVEPFLRFYS